MFATQFPQVTALADSQAPVSGLRRPLEERLSQGTVRRVEPKEDIFCEGDPRTHVFQVEQGVLAIYKTLPDGRRQIIDFAYKGDLVGLGMMREHTLSAQAVCAAKVRCLSARALEKAAEDDASLAVKLYRAVSQELAATRHLLVTLGQGSAIERLATFLLSLHRRLGNVDSNTVTLAMRRSDIGDLLGLTIETVSRTLAKLRSMGIIELEQGGTTIRIRDFDRLEQLAKD